MVTGDLTGFRLSPQQEHLWRAQGSRPARGFVCQGLLEVRGPLDRIRLRRAVEQVVECHEILRTAFPRLPGMSLPIQVIRARGQVLWDEPEISGPGEAEVERLLMEARRSPLPLEEEAAIQVSLLALGQERHALLLTLPGLMADAPSLHVLAHEIASLYAGEEGAGSPEPLQYADAAESLHEWLGPEDGPGAAFWRQRSLPAHDPADPGEPAVPETVHRCLPAGSVAGPANQMEVSVPLLLLAGWTAALWWETGVERCTITVSLDGRTFAELSRAVGLYARYLPLQCTAGPGITLSELARSLDGAMTTAAAWQDAFSVDRLAAGPAGEGPVLWPFGFDSHRTAVLSPAVSLRPAFVGLGRFGLRLSVLEDGTAVRLDLHYDPSRHSRSQAERLLDRLERVLAGAAGGEIPLGEIDVLTEAERRELLLDFNATAAPLPAGATASDLFEERARLAPHAPAVTPTEGSSLTFGELDARANRLARHLRGLGIGPESRVGILLDREPAMVVALLAVLKAGGAYVPFDTGYPAERLRFLMEDAGLAALVTRERLRPAAADAVRTVLVDAGSADAAAVSRQNDGPPPRLAGPGNAAYVIYTSGSTGRPKGVVVTHRGLVNYLVWARAAYAAGAERGAPVHSSLGFDLTVTSLFVPLLAGAAITLLPEEDGIGALAEALRKESGFGLAKLTPAHLGLLRQLTPAGDPPPSAACLVVGGDALWAADIAPWRGRGTRIFNEYGPTETVVGCCVHEMGPESPDAGAVPIGRPIANTRLYVMGPGLRPVPAGVPGELWIGGDGVARGYLGRPDLTAERFVPDPFALPDQAGGRLYRTGDLVCLSHPGPRLEFLGRIDDQVKIRGHRIEPGEVAAVLATHPGLRDAAVALRGSGDDRRLVAWAVPLDRARRPSASELRGFLAERLPVPMIPAAFVPLDVLPLTANGKLDRGALPDPELHRDEEAAYAPPRTLFEEVLAEIWSRVLGVDRVGIDDHFFSLGGDSIRSLQVLSLAQKRGLALTLQDLFERPTIRGLATRVNSGEGEAETVAASEPFSLLAPADRARLPQGIEDAYPLASLQAGMLFHTELSPDSAIYHDLRSFHVRASFSESRMREAVQQVSLLHPVLRTSFDVASFSEPLQLVHAGIRVPLEVHDLREVPPQEQEAVLSEWLRQERLQAFDWTRPPLIKLHVHIRDEGSFQFTISFHHAILDGWSAASLLTDLFRRYAVLLRGEEPSPDAPLTLAYRDFIALERAAVASDEARSFWSRMLDGAEPARLPQPPAAKAARSPAAGIHGIVIRVDPALSAGTQRAAREAEVPLKSLLFAVFIRVLSTLCGTADVLTAQVSHGRPEHADAEKVLGLFLNTLPFRVQLRGGSWCDLAREVFDLELQMLPFRRFPFAEMQRLEGGRLGLEAAFNYMHYHVYESTAGVQGIDILGEQDYEETNFPLLAHASLAPVSHDVTIRLIYRTPELDAGEIERLADYLHRALAVLVEDPSSRYDAVVLLTAHELAQVLGDPPGTSAPPLAGPVHHLFERQASRTPGSTALLWEERRMSYGELAANANRLARHLRSLGIGLETRVGVCAARSPRLVVALLAVLKAGGAYVPLDPAYPRERLAYMLADSGATVLLTERCLLDALPAAAAEVVLLDGCDEEPAVEESGPAAGLDEPVGLPESLAYLIYTSGSTGSPKAVAISQGSVAALVSWAVSVFSPEDLAGVVASTSVCFDLSIFELFVPLSCGGTVLLVDDALALALPQARETAARATLLNTVPSAAAELVRSGALPALLQVVNLAGERLPRALVDRLHAAGVPRVYNLYGPSEDTTYSTFARAAAGDSRQPAIGRAITGGRILLLDGWLQPVPPGIAGEVFLGGAGVSRGYFERPGLTAASFLPDPWSELPGDRLYRTGDLARYREDGELEFLGRTDDQVKIRGFRIELGEIESTLAAVAGVREAVVVAREDTPGDRRLVAYVVGDTAAEELRRSLRQRLPDSMLPVAFVKLPELPRTPNGKVDRKALPPPEPQSSGEDYVAPRTPVEEILAGIWAEVLGVERVGATDHFFDLSGHSLLATRVISHLRRAFDVEMPMRDLFATPVLAELAARVETLRLAGAVPPAPPLVPVPGEGPFLLSFAQQRLWFIDQLEPGSPLYNIPLALRVEGPLDSGVLALTLGEIERRHEALRTVFAVREGQPVQIIRPAAPAAIPLADLSGLPESRREPQALALVGEEARRPFDLERGPLLRKVLLRLADEDHIAALTLHHIVGDGWSIGILVREVTALYAAFAAGRPSPLPELPLQYRDFAVWQGSWLHGDVLESEIFYWRTQLAGLPPLLELPTDRPRPAVQSYRGAAQPVRLPAGLVRQTEALGRRNGATLFMVLLAALQALLARTSGQDDLAVGSPIAGRNQVETEGLIGFFVNTLVLRGELAGAPSFRDLLGRVRAAALAAYMHQDLPFEKLVEELAPERSLAHSPLFQVMLALQNAPAETLEIRGLRLRPANAAATTVKFDLTLDVTEHGGALLGTAEYATSLFDATTVQRLLAGFERLLAGAVADPDRCAADLPLLSAEELHQVRSEWNPAPPAPAASLVEMFESWVDRTPDAIALLAPGEALSYAGLDQRANRLAHRLRAHGVTIDSRVGLCAERSPEMIIAVLGILKAGAAYVPLDPTYPRERLAYLIEDAHVPVLLTREDILNAGESDSGPAAAERLPGVAAPESLAYVIYTSGSTGRPKGVMVHHRGLSHLAAAQQRLFAVRPGSHVLQFASLSFDASASEIAMALGAGATLVLGPPERRLSTEELTALLQGSTVVTLPPTVLATLAPDQLPGLETLAVAGEACPVELARLWTPGRRFLNAYGPTEATVCATMRLHDGGERLPIGRPIDGTESWILDARANPVPFGAVGELCVGGTGVARGYLHRPELTAASFVPHPFATLSGERLYRTGDLARYLPDGEVELLGRLDHQVKIRGFRIEPGEVEADLAALPGVREAAVVAREDRLVAYVSGDVATGELRRLLGERLPGYMVPSAFVVLAALPLTPNGKVDRNTLPSPEQQSAGESYRAPRTPIEEIVAGIWAELLGVERVGLDGQFFELGGHSLLAARVTSRLRSAFGIEMPLRDLFAAPRLADFVARVEAMRRIGAIRSAPPLQPVLREDPLPLSFAQERLWLLYLLEPESSAFHLGGAVRLTGALRPEAFAASLSETVRRHEVLRTRYQGSEHGPLQAVDPAAPLPLPLIDLGGLPEGAEGARESELRRLAEEERARPFDLTRDWPLRTHLVRLSREEHAALFTLHHIAGDGWALGLLTRDVGAHYAGFAVPEPAIQYADFSVWQRGWLAGERLEEELAWWRNRLAGPLPVLDLPQRQHQRPDTPGFRGAALPVIIPPGLRRSLEQIGHGEGATLFMTLLAGFTALLHLYSGQEDLLVGTNVANRDRNELEGLIGVFINNLVLRTDLSGDPGFRELVRRVRDVSLDAFAHQEVPFEKVLEAVQPQRQTAFAPLFQVMFVLQNFPMPELQSGGLEIAPLELEAQTANFELTLILNEGPDGLHGALFYDTDLFAEAAIARMAEHFLALLESAAGDPDLPLSAIPLTAESEIRQLASAFNEDD
jgi:amino acid adenylation domain-containing protein